jgi:hypothetical protein
MTMADRELTALEIERARKARTFAEERAAQLDRVKADLIARGVKISGKYA